MKKSKKGTLGKIIVVINAIELAMTIKATFWDRLPKTQQKKIVESVKGAVIRTFHYKTARVPFMKNFGKRSNSSGKNDISK